MKFVDDDKAPMLSTINRDALVDTVYVFIEVAKDEGYTIRTEMGFIRCNCVCGKVHIFQEEWSVPYESIICKCGRYIIYYSRGVIL